jgi:hypothetical protein
VDPLCLAFAFAPGDSAARGLGSSLNRPRDATVGGLDVPTPPATGQAGGVIDVYVHVITSSGGEGNLADSTIHDQISVLNSGFSTTGWSFDLVSVDRTANDEWFTLRIGSKQNRDAEAALRKGSADDLNIYTADTQAVVGWATYPWRYKTHPVNDGVVVWYQTLPGGGVPGFEEGDTTTHEVGHWMGLYHTFEGGCNNKGDYVSDTPSERSPNTISECDERRDTCTKDPGFDPIHNFMDYSSDACLNHFTAGQDARMDATRCSPSIAPGVSGRTGAGGRRSAG